MSVEPLPDQTGGGGDDPGAVFDRREAASSRMESYFGGRVEPRWNASIPDLARAADVATALGRSGAKTELEDYFRQINGVRENWVTARTFGGDSTEATRSLDRSTARIKTTLREAMADAGPQDRKALQAGYQQILEMAHLLDPKRLDRELWQ